jgi:hypothetical protein
VSEGRNTVTYESGEEPIANESVGKLIVSSIVSLYILVKMVAKSLVVHAYQCEACPLLIVCGLGY